MQPLAPASSVLVVVDVQDRLAAAMDPGKMAELTKGIRTLLESARVLGVRVVVTEQYPKGLGRTIPPIQEALNMLTTEPPIVEKVVFDATREEGFRRALSKPAPPTHVIVTGMETHICVAQTVRGLAAAGFEVHVPVDCVCSRTTSNRDIGVELIKRAGGIATSVEAVVFDWLGSAGTEAFKTLSRLMR